MDKTSRMHTLHELVMQCHACPLVKSRPKMVFGEGSLDALVMVIGEGPGQREAETGRPFVGRSGTLLRQMLEAIGLTEDLRYIANIVKDRPPKNRPPEQEEIELCVKFLRKQIEIIDPKILVLLGKTAIKGLCPEFKKHSIEDLRSKTKSLGLISYNNIPVIVTYHPSALLRTPWRKVGAKEDFIFVQSVLNELKERSSYV